MPTLNKLEYLDETKQEIKTALNTNFNSQITDEDTFRSYVSKIDNIYNNWPKVTGEGTEITLSNVKKGKMSLQPKGNTEQTTYSGKNLLKISGTKQTINGITFTQNADGSIGVKGTATANATYTSTTLQTIEPSKTYKLSGCPGGGSTSTYRLLLRVRRDETTNIVTISDTGSGGNLTTTAEAKYMLGEIIVYSGQTVNLTFYPQLELGSSPTSYEPYVGGTPSPNPDYPQEVKVVTGDNTINVHGKQLFQDEYIGVPSSDNINVILSAGTYTLSTCDSNNFGTNVYARLFDSSGSIITTGGHMTATSGGVGINWNFSTSSHSYYGGSNYSTITFTIDNDYQLNIGLLSSDSTRKVMLVKGSEVVRTYEPYQSQNYEINLGDIELCKIEDYQDVIFKNNQLSEHYDSTLDEDSWYIKKNIGKVVLDGSEYWNSLGGSGSNPYYVFYNNNTLVSNSIVNSTLYANYFITDQTSGFIQKDGGCRIANYNSVNRVFFCIHSITSVNDFKTWLGTHNIIVYYPLATPTYEKITNETLITQLEALNNAMSFDGTNYISSEYATGNAPVIISASALMKGGN